MLTSRSMLSSFCRWSQFKALIETIKEHYLLMCQSQWLRSLSRRSAAAHLLRFWVRIPPGAWMSASCECVRFQRRADDSSREVLMCDLEISWMRRPWPTLGCSATRKILIRMVTKRDREVFDLTMQSVTEMIWHWWQFIEVWIWKRQWQNDTDRWKRISVMSPAVPLCPQ